MSRKVLLGSDLFDLFAKNCVTLRMIDGLAIVPSEVKACDGDHGCACKSRASGEQISKTTKSRLLRDTDISPNGDTCANIVSATTAGVPLNVALQPSHRRSLWSHRGIFVCRFCISLTERKSRLGPDVFCGHRRKRSNGVDIHRLAARLRFETIVHLRRGAR